MYILSLIKDSVKKQIQSLHLNSIKLPKYMYHFRMIVLFDNRDDKYCALKQYPSNLIKNPTFNCTEQNLILRANRYRLSSSTSPQCDLHLKLWLVIKTRSRQFGRCRDWSELLLRIAFFSI